MKITFGIITNTNQNNNDYIKYIYQSIINQNIDDNFEIIIVGGKNICLQNIKHIPFDENIKNSWITKKKNIVAQEAKYNNIVLMHDYVYLDNLWYYNFKNFTENWDVCMNSIINTDNQRFRDWITWPEWCEENDIIFLNYEDNSRTKEMYISGTYFCVKKDFLLKYPLNESLSWGQGEDVEWSNRIRNIWNYKCNPYSKVKLLKHKYNEHWYKKCNEEARKKWMM